ncbi:MAG: CHAT domain-containing protein [Gemmatimonadetes bacterium]|nr:CHAT domain-containing protein [Gemmatimonadota bacterium]
MPNVRPVIRVARASALALALLAACRSDPPEPRSPFATADSLRDERRFAQAHPHYRRLRDSLAATPDTAGWWRAQLWWAQTLLRLGRADSSQVAIGDALALAGGDPARRGWTLWLRCGLWSRTGKPDAAITDCGQAIALAREAGDGELEARVHFALGTIYSRRGHYRLSVPETERALELERRFGRSPHQLAGVLNSMGVEYAAVGRLPEAVAAYEEGLARARRLADTSTAGVLISNLAALRSYTGRLDLAIELMEESLRSARAVGDSSSISYALTSLGDYYLKAGNRAEARARLTQALAISASQVPTVYRVMALVNLGRIEMADGLPDRARTTLDQALPLTVSGGFGLERFEIHQALAILAIGRGDARAARREAALARTVADSLGSPDVDFRSLELDGRVREMEARPDAPRRFLEAIELLESWRGRMALGDLRLGLAEPRWSVYEGAIRSLLARGDTVTAFEVTERARARRLLEILAERNPAAGAPLAAALKQRLRERFEERAAVGDSVGRLLDREIAALIDSLQALEAADPSAQRSAARHPRPISLNRIREALLGDGGTAILSIFWGDSAVYGWWITRDAIRARRLGRSDSLAATLDFLRSAIVRPDRDSLWIGPAVRAYQALLAPFSPGGESAVIALVDGPLARVPVEVLIPRPGAPPLATTHRIEYGPSASVLAALAGPAPVARWQRVVLAVGNPRGGAGPGIAPPGPRAPRATARLDLPHAEEEARGIVELYRARGSDLLVGREATVARWMELHPGRYQYLHFAAHAQADDRETDGSRLFLANGALDLPTIRQLDLTADLVTLSACETALGREVRGEGVMGLAHAFLAAGARRTLVTLWPVGDRSTALFMSEFYGELSGGRTPAAALQAVRRRWLDQAATATRHPAHWAPFILLGAPSDSRVPGPVTPTLQR